MFKKLPAEKLKKKASLKTNLLQKLKQRAAESMPLFPEIEDDLFPKKTPVIVYHLEDHKAIYAVNDKPVLAELSHGEVIPHLEVAIAHPGLLKCVYVDDGAVKALLRGADLKAPGIKQYGDEFEEGDIIEVRLLETDIPFAIGVAAASSAAVKESGKDTAITIAHILKDGLWDKRNGM